MTRGQLAMGCNGNRRSGAVYHSEVGPPQQAPGRKPAFRAECGLSRHIVADDYQNRTIRQRPKFLHRCRRGRGDGHQSERTIAGRAHQLGAMAGVAGDELRNRDVEIFARSGVNSYWHDRPLIPQQGAPHGARLLPRRAARASRQAPCGFRSDTSAASAARDRPALADVVASRHARRQPSSSRPRPLPASREWAFRSEKIATTQRQLRAFVYFRIRCSPSGLLGTPECSAMSVHVIKTHKPAETGKN